MRSLTSQKLFWLSAAGALFGLAVTLIAQRNPGFQTSDLNRPLESLLVIERKNNHLGEGAAISPDGRLLAYIGGDDGLYLRNLDTKQEQLLLRETEPGLDVFLSPSFSPDGTLVLFSASGGTYYYPSNIYSIGVDGSGLKRLTRAQAHAPEEKMAVGNAFYAQYFHSAQFGPDGRKILLQLYDAVTGDDNVALMDPDGSHLESVDRGTPLCWSSDSQAVYYSFADIVKKYDLRTKESQTIAGLGGKVLGRFPDKEVLGVDNGEYLSLVTVQDGAAETTMRWTVPRTRFAAREAQRTAVSNMDQLVLKSFQWSRSGRLLLVYEGEVIEQLEVVAPGNL